MADLAKIIVPPLVAGLVFGVLLAVLWVAIWTIAVPEVLPWAVWDGYDALTELVFVLGFCGGAVSSKIFKS